MVDYECKFLQIDTQQIKYYYRLQAEITMSLQIYMNDENKKSRLYIANNYGSFYSSIHHVKCK